MAAAFVSDAITRVDALGIDSGLEGAVAVIAPAPVEVRVTSSLATGNDSRRPLDTAKTVAMLERDELERTVIEAVAVILVPGVAGISNFGVGLGRASARRCGLFTRSSRFGGGRRRRGLACAGALPGCLASGEPADHGQPLLRATRLRSLSMTAGCCSDASTRTKPQSGDST